MAGAQRDGQPAVFHRITRLRVPPLHFTPLIGIAESFRSAEDVLQQRQRDRSGGCHTKTLTTAIAKERATW
jgi:hypothetical protein